MDPRGTILLSTALRIVGAIAISVEEAVAMGVVIGVAGVVSFGGGPNIKYSKSYDMPKYGSPGSTIYENGSIGQYDANGHLIGRKDFAEH